MQGVFDNIKWWFLALRPKQWIKNLLVFAFIFFYRDITNFYDLRKVFWAFIALIILSSSVYLINDVVDYKRDKIHPIKKNRPIASDKISRKEAIVGSIIFFLLGLILALSIGEYLLFIYVFYYFLVLFYSLYLKNVLIIDSLTNAVGFVLRVIAGGVVIGAPINSWFIIFIICASLFISFGKRRAEITMLSFKRASEHRSVLRDYPKDFLDSLISMTGAATFFSYILFSYTIDIGNSTPALVSSVLPAHVKNPHWFKITIPLGFYILARYLYDIYVKKEGDAPETVCFEDRYILYSTVLYFIVSTFVIYII